MFSATKTSIQATGLAFLALAAGSLASPAALAAEPQEVGAVTIRAARPIETKVGRTSSGIPVVQYELSFKVSYEDLDLASQGGADALTQRVRDAAKAVCADLDKMYPQVAPEGDCARNAEREAMPEVDAAIAAARNR